jgi:hypothetical protein
MTINDDGSLTIVDFFMPQEKQALDGADKDLGTSPLEMLPSEFACGDISRIGVVTGKSGKTYWLNLDNLGGYRMGPDSGDAVIQVYQNENSVYAGAAVYPLEGGYIYINGELYCPAFRTPISFQTKRVIVAPKGPQGLTGNKSSTTLATCSSSLATMAYRPSPKWPTLQRIMPVSSESAMVPLPLSMSREQVLFG